LSPENEAERRKPRQERFHVFLRYVDLEIRCYVQEAKNIFEHRQGLELVFFIKVNPNPIGSESLQVPLNPCVISPIVQEGIRDKGC